VIPAKLVVCFDLFMIMFDYGMHCTWDCVLAYCWISICNW